MAEIKIGIIGAGPSGIACAIQLKRYGLNPLLFEKAQIGGLVKNASLVENYLGFLRGIRGEEFIKLLRGQLIKNEIPVLKEEVLLATYRKKEFYIKTQKKTYPVSVLVLASGTKPKRLTIPFNPLCEARIFYEIYPLRNIKNKIIAILGGGDAAFDYALSVSRSNRVLILNRSHRYRALPLLYHRVMKNKKIIYIANVQLTHVDWQNRRLVLSSTKGENITADYLVVAIGREPNLDFLDKSIKKRMATLEKRKKIYMIGDVRHGDFRQVAIAAGDGIRAAMEIYQNYKEGMDKNKYER